MNKILSIPLIALLLSSCSTKPSKQAYDYLSFEPIKFGQSVHYTLNAPVIVMEEENGFWIEYETDVDRYLPSNGAKLKLRRFLIETAKSHIHLKCENESTTPFEIDENTYILDLRAEFSDSSDDTLTLWREQDYLDKIKAQEAALGIAAQKLIQDHLNKN